MRPNTQLTRRDSVCGVCLESIGRGYTPPGRTNRVITFHRVLRDTRDFKVEASLSASEEAQLRETHRDTFSTSHHVSFLFTGHFGIESYTHLFLIYVSNLSLLSLSDVNNDNGAH